MIWRILPEFICVHPTVFKAAINFLTQWLNQLVSKHIYWNSDSSCSCYPRYRLYFHYRFQSCDYYLIYLTGSWELGQSEWETENWFWAQSCVYQDMRILRAYIITCKSFFYFEFYTMCLDHVHFPLPTPLRFNPFLYLPKCSCRHEGVVKCSLTLSGSGRWMGIQVTTTYTLFLVSFMVSAKHTCYSFQL